MEETTKAFIKKIKFDTYIYTLTFLIMSIGYSLKHSVSLEPIMLLLAAFAFYTLGRQVICFQILKLEQK